MAKHTLERIWPAEILRAVKDGRVSLDYALRICRGRRKKELVGQIFLDYMGGEHIETCIDRLCAGNNNINRLYHDEQMLYEGGYINVQMIKHPGEPWLVTWRADKP